MRRAPLAAILACAATGAGLGLPPAAAQRPQAADAPVPTASVTIASVTIAPVPPGKPPPLGAPGDRAPGAGPRVFGTGSGFVVADRRLLTNRHVVADCARVVARGDAGPPLPVQVIAADRERDLALLSTDAPAGPPLVFREGPPVRRGESVIVYGFPLSGLLSSGPTLTTGNVSALAGLRDDATAFQISAAVQPGSSGGPLFDSHAHVIGVVVSKLNAARVAAIMGGDIPQNVNFALKGGVALAFLRANGVQPSVAPSTGPERRPDEVDAVADPSTVALQCFR